MSNDAKFDFCFVTECMFQFLFNNNNNFEINIFTAELQLLKMHNWTRSANTFQPATYQEHSISTYLARIPSKRYSKKLKKMALLTALILWELLNQYLIQSAKQYVSQLMSIIYIPWTLMTTTAQFLKFSHRLIQYSETNSVWSHHQEKYGGVT
jgi:hypothetical protein